MEDAEFRKFFEALRRLDPKAFERLDQEFLPKLRAYIRTLLTEWNLRRLADSGDIAQSVVLRLLSSVDRYDMITPEQLHAMLKTIAENLLRDLARKRKPVELPDGANAPDPITPDTSPSLQATIAELLAKFHNELSDWGHRVHALRLAGRTWSQIATDLGKPVDAAQAVRVRYNREVERVMGRLGLL